MKSAWHDRTSPIAYGFEDKTLPVYFNQDPVLNVGRRRRRAAGFGGGGGGRAGVGQNTTPMAASPNRIASLEPEAHARRASQADAATTSARWRAGWA